MKHDFKITLVLVALFFLAQVIGLVVVNAYIDVQATEETGNLTFEELPAIGTYEFERPDIEEEASFAYIFGAIIVATIILLILIKYAKPIIWKVWFFLAVSLTLFIAFGAFIPGTVALLLGIVLAAIKIFRPNIYIHNFTELFVYAGIAAIFVPVINFFAMVILLLLISVYDMYAVWKSKHMIKMAQMQTKAGVFAGLLIPYHPTKASKMKHKKKKPHPVSTAVLGGGDIGFPLLFAGVVLKSVGFWKALIIPPFVTIALYALLHYGKKGRFYPAMPFLTIGCFVGYFVLLLVL